MAEENEYLKPNEIGCYNCTRWRTGSKRCDYCVKFSEFKNINTLNVELKEKALDHLCVSSIEQLRHRQRKRPYLIEKLKRRKEI